MAWGKEKRQSGRRAEELDRLLRQHAGQPLSSVPGGFRGVTEREWIEWRWWKDEQGLPAPGPMPEIPDYGRGRARKTPKRATCKRCGRWIQETETRCELCPKEPRKKAQRKQRKTAT